MAIIIETYVETVEDRFYDEPGIESVEHDERAPFLLGKDLAQRGSDQHIAAMTDFIDGVSARPAPAARSTGSGRRGWQRGRRTGR